MDNSSMHRREEAEVFALHEAAARGERSKVKRLLRTGTPVDCVNAHGETALHVACAEGHESTVELLLKNHAQLNRRCVLGATAAHAAAQGGCVRVMEYLLAAGADFCLHDNRGRSVADCCSKLKMADFLERTRRNAILGKDADQTTIMSLDLSRREKVETPIVGWLRAKWTRRPLQRNVVLHTGYGTLLHDGSGVCESLASLPLIPEHLLDLDVSGCSYGSAQHSIMQSMSWHSSKVSVRKGKGRRSSDLLRHEHNVLRKIRHPKLLSLLGVSRSHDVQELSLVFERVSDGSLHSWMHQRKKPLTDAAICEIFVGICEGVEFLHDQGLLHCAISSHAVHLVSAASLSAKLSNLEFAVSREVDEAEWKSVMQPVSESLLVQANHPWMDPELLRGGMPSVGSDVYSMAALLWEMLTGAVPWSGIPAIEVVCMLTNGRILPVSNALRDPLKTHLRHALNNDPSQRMRSVADLKDCVLQEREKLLETEVQNSTLASNTATTCNASMLTKSGINRSAGPLISSDVMHTSTPVQYAEDRKGLNLRRRQKSSVYNLLTQSFPLFADTLPLRSKAPPFDCQETAPIPKSRKTPLKGGPCKTFYKPATHHSPSTFCDRPSRQRVLSKEMNAKIAAVSTQDFSCQTKNMAGRNGDAAAVLKPFTAEAAPTQVKMAQGSVKELGSRAFVGQRTDELKKEGRRSNIHAEKTAEALPPLNSPETLSDGYIDDDIAAGGLNVQLISRDSCSLPMRMTSDLSLKSESALQFRPEYYKLDWTCVPDQDTTEV